MLELTFITSSRIKLEHAMHLCQEYTVNIVEKKYYGKGYEEPRIHERDELLRKSIEDALIRWNKNVTNPGEKFFFIEDTSVIIHSLSTYDLEVPGVDIKYWMKSNDFESVDIKLKALGNDRRVTVRSDVLLTLTDSLKKEGSQPFKRFSSKVTGSIVEHELEVTTNPVYPWLDDKTFNKWFVPDGSSLPLSMLSIEEADKYDFRNGAFKAMLNFLVEKNLVGKKEDHGSHSTMVQASMPIDPPLFVVCEIGRASCRERV